MTDHARFIDCEKWRKDFGVDDLVQNFNYTEKEEIFKYYPQFYHKTDKVLSLSLFTLYISSAYLSLLGWPPRVHRTARQG